MANVDQICAKVVEQNERVAQGCHDGKSGMGFLLGRAIAEVKGPLDDETLKGLRSGLVRAIKAKYAPTADYGSGFYAAVSEEEPEGRPSGRYSKHP